jgi:hypothetical protein
VLYNGQKVYDTANETTGLYIISVFFKCNHKSEFFKVYAESSNSALDTVLLRQDLNPEGCIITVQEYDTIAFG